MPPSDLYRLIWPEFRLPPPESLGRIAEVAIGATEEEGGTRGRKVVLGGGRWLPFFSGEGPPRKPAIAMQVLDVPYGVPQPVREAIGDAVNDPVDWARECVRSGAEMVALCLVSTSPGVKGSSPEQAARVVGDVLQAVDVPLIIAGSGDARRDPAVLERAAEAARGERCLLASASLDNDYGRIASSAMAHGHAVLASSVCDPSQQRTLNERLLDLGVPLDRLVMDPLTAPLGYGLDYTFNHVEILRSLALRGGVDSLRAPIAAVTANAWSAREARSTDDELGPVGVRGPLWEAMTAIPLFLAGAELFVMLHPRAARELDRLLSDVLSTERPKLPYRGWIAMTG